MTEQHKEEYKTLNDPDFLKIRDMYMFNYVKRDNLYSYIRSVYYDDVKDFICFDCDSFNRITIPYQSDTIIFGKKYIDVFDRDYFFKHHDEILTIITKDEYYSAVDKYIDFIVKMNENKYDEII